MTLQEMIQRQAKQFISHRFPELYASDSPVYQLQLAEVVKHIEAAQNARYPYMPLMAYTQLHFVSFAPLTLLNSKSLQSHYEEKVAEVFRNLSPGLVHMTVMTFDKWLMDHDLVYPQNYVHETATKLIMDGARDAASLIERFEHLHRDQLGDDWMDLTRREVSKSIMGRVFEMAKVWVTRDVEAGIIKISSDSINGQTISFVEPLMFSIGMMVQADDSIDWTQVKKQYVELRDYGYQFGMQPQGDMKNNNCGFNQLQSMQQHFGQGGFNFHHTPKLKLLMNKDLIIEYIANMFAVYEITLPKDKLLNLAEYAMNKRVSDTRELEKLMHEAAINTHGANYIVVLRDLYPKAQLLLPPEEPQRVNAKAVTLPGYQFERDDVFYVVNREYGQSPNGNPFQGAWVCRDYHSGAYIDHDRNRTNLAQRLSIKLEEN